MINGPICGAQKKKLMIGAVSKDNAMQYTGRGNGEEAGEFSGYELNIFRGKQKTVLRILRDQLQSVALRISDQYSSNMAAFNYVAESKNGCIHDYQISCVRGVCKLQFAEILR